MSDRKLLTETEVDAIAATLTKSTSRAYHPVPLSRCEVLDLIHTLRHVRKLEEHWVCRMNEIEALINKP